MDPLKLVDPNMAMNAYRSTAGMQVARGAVGAGQTDESGDSEGSGSAGGTQFTDFLKAKTQESIGTLEVSEKLSAKAVTGEADLTDVVEAVTNAELTLNTTVAIRDRMISAYQEIMRMPI